MVPPHHLHGIACSDKALHTYPFLTFSGKASAPACPCLRATMLYNLYLKMMNFCHFNVKLRGKWQKLMSCQNTAASGPYKAKHSVAGGLMVLSCSSVRPSVRALVCASRNTVNTISCRVFDTFSPNLHQRCVKGQK